MDLVLRQHAPGSGLPWTVLRQIIVAKHNGTAAMQEGIP
jgi:hypothetical protein